MADDDQIDDGALSARKRKRKLMMIAGAAVLALAIGAGSWFFLFRGNGEQQQAETAPAKPPVFMDVPELLVNLAPSRASARNILK